MPHHRTTQAIERAAAMYAARGANLSIVLEAYLRNPLGYVIKRPEMLLVFRPCDLADPDRWLKPTEAPRAWYVQLLVGATPRAALEEMPYVLPHCCWHREWRADGGRLHIFPTDYLIRKTQPLSHHGLHSRRSSHAA